jgi:hypothetical protein
MGTGNDERFVDPYAYHRAQCPAAGSDPTWFVQNKPT